MFRMGLKKKKRRHEAEEKEMKRGVPWLNDHGGGHFITIKVRRETLCLAVSCGIRRRREGG